MWLMVMTVLLCCLAYPIVLWGVGQSVFPHQANGSLVDEDGNPVTDSVKARGSLLIAQPFNGDDYFKPRPSAAGYDASASGASNLAASNVLLRSRVARQLGPIVKYAADSPVKPGKPVGPDVERWFQRQGRAKPDYVARWAKAHPILAEQYVKENPEAVARWLKENRAEGWGNRSEDDNIKEAKNSSGAVAKLFFAKFSKNAPRAWPAVDNKVVRPTTEKSDDIRGYFFDLWLQDPAQRGAVLEQVPSDMVMASGSGLDPHITLKNALYQIDRIADKWAAKPELAGATAEIKKTLRSLLDEKASSPMGGLAGVSMVNVLEVNLALRRRLAHLAEHAR
jgi:K+-transporting ATPase ATPase C chain